MKMKRIWTFLLMITLCFSIIVSTTGCSLLKHPIDRFEEAVLNADSFKMKVNMSPFPLFGTAEMVFLFDENLQYTSIAYATMTVNESYIETVGNTKYKYKQDGAGKWTKTESGEGEQDDTLFDGELDEKIFNPKNYKRVWGEKNTFEQKSDVDFGEIKNVKIIIYDDSYVMRFKMVVQNMTIDVRVSFSQINEVEITLPEVE